jgi:hypothetical protein
MAGTVLIRRAKDKRKGMTLDEIMSAIVHAREMGLTRLVRTRVGFAGQVQSMEFGDTPDARAYIASQPMGDAGS